MQTAEPRYSLRAYSQAALHSKLDKILQIKEDTAIRNFPVQLAVWVAMTDEKGNCILFSKAAKVVPTTIVSLLCEQLLF